MGPYIRFLRSTVMGVSRRRWNATTAWRQSKKQDWETAEELYPTARNHRKPGESGEKYCTSDPWPDYSSSCNVDSIILCTLSISCACVIYIRLSSGAVADISAYAQQKYNSGMLTI